MAGEVSARMNEGQQMVERILIGHVQNHLGSIRTTLAARQ